MCIIAPLMPHLHSSQPKSILIFLDSWQSTQTRRLSCTMPWPRSSALSAACPWTSQPATSPLGEPTIPWAEQHTHGMACELVAEHTEGDRWVKEISARKHRPPTPLCVTFPIPVLLLSTHHIFSLSSCVCPVFTSLLLSTST